LLQVKCFNIGGKLSKYVILFSAQFNISNVCGKLFNSIILL